MSHGRTLVLAAGLLTAVPAAADDVLLHGGGRISGVIVKRTPRAVVIETSPGLVTIPASRIASIVESESSLETWRQRSAALHPGDVRGWAALARWASEAGLTTQARTAWQRVLAADPGHAEAHRALGHVQLEGAWLDADEAYRARGFVQAGGRWVSPAEHEALLREQALDEERRAERTAAEVRLREAEARAREAEANARAAEAGSNLPADGVWLGGIGWGYVEDGRRGGHRRDGDGRHRREPGRYPGSSKNGAAGPTPIGGNAGGRPAEPTPIGGGNSLLRPPASNIPAPPLQVPRN